MQPINHDNYRSLLSAIERGDYISCKKGHWKTDNGVIRFIRWIFGRETDRLQNIVKTFVTALDELEAQSYHNRIDETITAQNIARLSGAIERYVGQNRSCAQSLNEMKLKVVSLKYRTQVLLPGAGSPALTQQFQQLVRDWKESDPLFHDKELKPWDLAKIDEFCQYPEFAQHLIDNPQQAYLQFKIAIRDNVQVNALVEFNHHVVDILYKCHMTCRIGAFSQPLLNVWSQGPKKNLELTIEGNPIDILNPNKVVTFSDGFQTTLTAIFKSFKYLNVQPSSGEYEFFRDGLRRWNGHKWGPKLVGRSGYNSIDVTVDRFWEKPDFPIYDIVNKEHIQRKYQIQIQDPLKTIQVLEATRSTQGIGLDGHGYTIFYIPTEDANNYKVIPVGLYANQFPVGEFEKASFIADTVPGTIVFPDPNYTYTRQKASIATEISDEQLEMQMKRLAATRINGGWFMWTWENCCHYAKKLFMEVIEDPALHSIIKKRTFKVLFLDCKPDNCFISLIQKGYRVVQIPYLKTIYEEFVFLILGTWRSLTVTETVIEENEEYQHIIKKSSYQSKFCKSIVNNLPGVFHDHVEKGEIPGAVLSYGHGRYA